ncbi:MAG: putative drug transport protein [Acidobacteria bacterium]|nr:putative drug transport protein [Acidobacteriota bacterium]
MPQEQTIQGVDRRTNVALGVAAVFLVVGTMSYFIQALNIARPKIAAALDGMSLYAWSVSIPALASAFSALIFGKLSDMYGRRIMLLISVIFALVGTVSCVFCTNFVFLIAAFTVANVGLGASMPLGMAVLGDLFPPVERSKWIGLMNIPMGIAALLGPTLGGWFADTMGWSAVFWSIIPLLVVCVALVPLGTPSLATPGVTRRIDVLGCVLAILASSTTIIGISLAGDVFPWASKQVICLLGASLIFWVLFLRAEYRVEEPILDPQVLRNRSFSTVAAATLLSCLGQIGMMMYFPMFLQGVKSISAARSGMIFTPFSLMMAFMGIPVGFLIARTKRYKLLYVIGFFVLTVQMFGNLLFTAEIPVVWCVIAATVGGLGLGTIPTVNTVIIQNAIPKRLLGAAMGAFFFCMLLGIAISPAILGSAMNTTYARSLTLPAVLEQAADKEILEAVRNPNALLSQEKLAELKTLFDKRGGGGEDLFQQTVEAMRAAMETGLRSVFLIGAVTMLLAFLLITTIPEVPIGSEAKSEEAAGE